MSGDHLTVASTTDDQSAVQTAADYQPGEPTPKTIGLTSNDAPGDQLVAARHDNADGDIAFPTEPGASATQKPPRVVSSTDPPEETARVEAELREDQQTTGRELFGSAPQRRQKNR